MIPKPAKGLSAPTVVTAHINADFDALAAMIAASKLYPDATLIFPGSQEKNLRNFFIQSATYLFNFKTFKDIDPDSVRTLVLVDTRQRSRVSHVAPLLERPGVEVHLYDHHPDTEEDVPGQVSVVRPWGSTTTILTHLIRERGLSLTPDEATFLALGIYEDTGSFTFTSTVEEDFQAGAWLKSQGMDMATLSELLTRELSAEQITIMSALIESAATYDINGVEVVVAQTAMDNYVGDFALLAHKLMDMQNIRVLFALALMKDRVHLVARSRTADVDVGRICASLGGGGHAYAASASLKDKTLTQAREDLFGLLYSQVNPQILAASLMSAPAKTVREDQTLAQADEVMTHFGLKAVPVLDAGDGQCVGILEHDIVDKAVKHGLGGSQAGEYMVHGALCVAPATELYRITEIILNQRQRLVPVVENGKVAGVVTRTDLINVLVREPARIPETVGAGRRGERSMAGHLRDRLPKGLLALLKRAGSLAKSMGYEAYVVGGFVRDLILGRPNLDLDLVVEGDGILFAEAMARELGGRVKSHHKFQTAAVLLHDGNRVDVATARLEYYEYPAALPTVELSSIKMDLYRRDFTINALAIHLSPERFGRLVDFFDAQRDLKDRMIRVLHSLSFVEDPTRILRAIRFEQRFHFKIGAQTERLIRNAIANQFVHKLSGPRVFHEMRHIMEDDRPLASIRRMDELKLLAAIHPDLALDPRKDEVLAEAERVITWYALLYVEPKPEVWRIYFLGLCAGMEDDQVQGVARRLGFSKHLEESFLALRHSIRNTAQQIFEWDYRRGLHSELYFLLKDLPLEGVLYLMARNPKETVQRSISLFLTTLRTLRVELAGADLKAMGLPPGPRYAQILRAVTAAMLDGKATCRAEQMALAKRMAEKDMGLEWMPGAAPTP
ncbi:CCA-adding enzyme [Fundidesulfovibrio magnetotacticus]|uniref:CCA-adding enzyme n=1 Tax=Fundidesulfovibrio magnetotacticus TaxID=2730080 RepID=A0A6V8LYF0_9BACT|nr:CBS domain-containing protein [Fundidesulfovibrio magnetotacticus]GFK95840.1 CCA-adding enzyme [Fundidesulfovibrio magnetotacticus]